MQVLEGLVQLSEALQAPPMALAVEKGAVVDGVFELELELILSHMTQKPMLPLHRAPAKTR